LIAILYLSYLYSEKQIKLGTHYENWLSRDRRFRLANLKLPGVKFPVLSREAPLSINEQTKIKPLPVQPTVKKTAKKTRRKKK
jgi:hypothetical protein